MIVADGELHRRADRGRVANRFIAQVQIDEHEVNPGNRHALAGTAAGPRIARPVRPRIVARSVSLAPNRRAFFRFDHAPACQQRTRRDEEITAGLSFQRLPGRPYIIPEGWVLQEKPVAFLPHQRRVMADFPMNDRRDDERAAFFAKGHLIIQTNLLREFSHLRQRETLLGRGGVENRHVARPLRIQRQFDLLQRHRPTTKGNLRAVLHVPKPLPRANDFLRRRADKHPVLDRLEQRLQFRHAPEPRIHVSQFARGPVSNGSACGIRCILGKSPGFTPRIKGF